ncbi:MAG: hypothetical protein HOV70_23725 [Streptomyces sp.]|nr:hypothetical protein [Streptomyces sp.]
MSTQQLTLDIPAQRPAPRVYLRVDEIGIAQYTPRETAQWWELFRRRMPDRLTTVLVRMPGDLVDIACDNRAHANWLHEQFRKRGVPQQSLTIRTEAAERQDGAQPS